MDAHDDEDTRLRSVASQNAAAIRLARQRAEQRSEFYLAEGQRLAHMGSWALNPSGVFDYCLLSCSGFTVSIRSRASPHLTNISRASTRKTGSSWQEL